MPTTTTNYSFQKPTIGADEDDWGGYLNANWDSIDTILANFGAGAVDDIFYENNQEVTSNYTLVATKNAMTTGPVTINSGITVTISTGARWVVL
jgi:hypothetical protein